VFQIDPADSFELASLGGIPELAVRRSFRADAYQAEMTEWPIDSELVQIHGRDGRWERPI